MRVICVDDEELILQMTVSLCEEMDEISEVNGFLSAGETLDWLQDHEPDIALLDINLPDMDGITLAKKIQEIYPDMAIIFLTGYTEYALDAFSVHASGYLCKPITRESLKAEVDYAIERLNLIAKSNVHVHTFGEFDVFVDGELLSFGRTRAKALLAILVDRYGGSITRAEAFSMLWEKGVYDRAMQKQLDVVIRSLRDTLEKYGISDIFELKRGSMRIVPERISCDFYRFIDGDEKAIKAYHGEYMNAYSWARQTEAYLDQRKKEAEQKQ